MAGYADCLAGFIEGLRLDKPHVAGLSFGRALALGLFRRPQHPGDADTGVRTRRVGRLSPADAAEPRLRQALALADRSPEEFVRALLPTMFSVGTAPEAVEACRETMLAFHPVGFQAMARASAEDLRDAPPLLDVPTLLIYGDQDVHAPLTVAEELHAAISGSELVVLPGVGHVSNVEAPEQSNTEVRTFLHSS